MPIIRRDTSLRPYAAPHFCSTVQSQQHKSNKACLLSEGLRGQRTSPNKMHKYTEPTDRHTDTHPIRHTHRGTHKQVPMNSINTHAHMLTWTQHMHIGACMDIITKQQCYPWTNTLQQTKFDKHTNSSKHTHISLYVRISLTKNWGLHEGLGSIDIYWILNLNLSHSQTTVTWELGRTFFWPL